MPIKFNKKYPDVIQYLGHFWKNIIASNSIQNSVKKMAKLEPTDGIFGSNRKFKKFGPAATLPDRVSFESNPKCPREIQSNWAIYRYVSTNLGGCDAEIHSINSLDLHTSENRGSLA